MLQGFQEFPPQEIPEGASTASPGSPGRSNAPLSYDGGVLIPDSPESLRELTRHPPGIGK